MIAGLEFIPENGGWAGIRFRERKGEALERAGRTIENLKAKGYLK